MLSSNVTEAIRKYKLEIQSEHSDKEIVILYFILAICGLHMPSTMS
jgi:hypothetical protein